jgi:hypothetical protein
MKAAVREWAIDAPIVSPGAVLDARKAIILRIWLRGEASQSAAAAGARGIRRSPGRVWWASVGFVLTACRTVGRLADPGP